MGLYFCSDYLAKEGTEMPRQTVNESTDANTFNKAAAPQVVQAAACLKT